jgi:hypothetical protein
LQETVLDFVFFSLSGAIAMNVVAREGFGFREIPQFNEISQKVLAEGSALFGGAEGNWNDPNGKRLNWNNERELIQNQDDLPIQ